MAKTVLQYVQACLSTMDSDSVTTISGTVESQQIADCLFDTYYELLNREEWDWLHGPIQLVQVGSALTPTSFTIPPLVRQLKYISYNIDETGTSYTADEILYVPPEEFLRRYGNSTVGTGTQQLVTLGSQLKFFVTNNQQPKYWTTFDDTTIVMDAYKIAVDPTFLLTTKITCLGVQNPSFTVADSFVPVMPEHMIPLLQHELNAASHIYFKQAVSKVDEKKATRQMAQARRKGARVPDINKQYYANAFGRRVFGTQAVTYRTGNDN